MPVWSWSLVQGLRKSSPYVDRFQFYTLRAERLSYLIAIGCYYGDRSYYDLWIKVIEKIANPPHALFLNSDDTRGISTLILFYSAGIAAIAAQKYDLLATLFLSPKIGKANNEEFVVSGTASRKDDASPWQQTATDEKRQETSHPA